MTNKVTKQGFDTSQGIDLSNDTTIEANKSEDLVLSVKQNNQLYSSSFKLFSGTSYSSVNQTYSSGGSFASIKGNESSKILKISFDVLDIRNINDVTKHTFSSSQESSISEYLQINDSSCSITSSNSSYKRWQIVTKSEDSETGANSGSDFGVYRYSDIGVKIDKPLWIYRDSGKVEFAKTPTILEKIPVNSSDDTVISSRWVQQNLKSGGSKNILLNPFFQVNQEASVSPKATGASVSGVYLVDGWKIKSTSGVSKNFSFSSLPEGGSVSIPDSSSKLEQRILREQMPPAVYVINPLVDSNSVSLVGEVIVYDASNVVLSSTTISFDKMTKKSSLVVDDAYSSFPVGFGNLSEGISINLIGVSYNSISISFTGPGIVYGCQVEIGETPSKIEARNFFDELQRCKFFYQKSYEYAVSVGSVTYIGASMNMSEQPSGFLNSSTFLECSMRTNPALTVYPVSIANTPGSVTYITNLGVVGTTSSINISNKSSKMFNVSLNGTPSTSRFLHYHWVADARI